MIEQIKWLGHGSFQIEGPPIIYINPWRVIRTAFLADIILVSHDHYDHCSVADIEKLRGEQTIVIGNEKVASMIPDVTILRPWQSITIDRVNIKGVPAYSPNSVQHSLEDGGLGFVISMNYYDIYYAGDTGIIDEMRRIQPDIAILPIDNDGTLSVDEALEVVKIIHPKWVIPSNWGARGEGATRTEANTFKERVGNLARVALPD